jgi:8-oxo-dGTP pyrophosphatase MutT (NUDIX family)
VAELSWEGIANALAARPPKPLSEPVSAWAAVALLLRSGPSGTELLFIQRAERSGDPWSGQMAFPGGRAARGESDLVLTATRETLEETGIDLAACAELLGGLDRVRARARLRPVDLAIAPYVFRLHQPIEARLSAEVHGIHWLALARLLEPGHRSTYDYAREGQALTFPCLRIGPVVIWGLTYRIFKNFQERLEA